MTEKFSHPILGLRKTIGVCIIPPCFPTSEGFKWPFYGLQMTLRQTIKESANMQFLIAGKHSQITRLFFMAIAFFALLPVPSHAQTLKELLAPIWELTKADATDGQRREYAGYITLDTATGEYGLKDVEHGDWAPNDEPAGMGLALPPPDIPENPTPLDTVVYVVAWFHTHTPTTYVTVPYRPVGPGDGDFAASIHPLINLPGFALDYAASPAPNHPPDTVPAGHPKDGETMLYPITPPNRRPLP